MIPVLICGGFGTKLWPVSREHKPKHFLPLINSKFTEKFNQKHKKILIKPLQIQKTYDRRIPIRIYSINHNS